MDKKLFKKSFCFLIAVITVFATIPFVSIPTSAAIPTGSSLTKNATLAANFDTLMKNYVPNVSFFSKNGKACSCHNNSSINCIAATHANCNCLRRIQYEGRTIDLGTVQCFGYARYCQQILFGVNEYTNADKFDTITGPGAVTAATFKNWMLANKGKFHICTHIRLLNSHHSVSVLNVDYTNEKITFVECNCVNQSVNNGLWCKVNNVQTSTWSSFASRFGSMNYAKVLKNFDTLYPDVAIPKLTIKYNINGGIMDCNDYVVKVANNSGLWLRASYSTASAKVISSPMMNDTVLKVTELQKAGGYTWGKTVYNGISGWCALTTDAGGVFAVKRFKTNADDVYYNTTGEVLSQTIYYGSAIGGNGLWNDTTLCISKEGSKFAGWSLSADGSTTVFDKDNAALKAEDIYPDIKNKDATVTLFAVWQPYHTHEYTQAITTQPTPFAEGVRTFTCACGDTYTESIPVSTINALRVKYYNNHVYETFSTPLSWDEAEKYCREYRNGHLVSINDADEQAFIQNNLLYKTTKQYYIGAQKGENGVWSWTDGKNADYTNWTTGQMSSDPSVNHATLAFDGAKWTESRGEYNSAVGFICEIETENLVPTCTFKANGHKYEVYNSTLSWGEALQCCTWRGGHLVSIADAEEQQIVSQIYSQIKTAGTFCWIGAECPAKNGKWVWADNTPFIFANWAAGQPDYLNGTETCLAMNKADGLWYDRTWSNPLIEIGEYSFICEYDEYEEDTMTGDIDGDNKVTAKDLVILKGCIVGSEIQTPACDVNGDGKINVNDVILLKTIILGT